MPTWEISPCANSGIGYSGTASSYPSMGGTCLAGGNENRHQVKAPTAYTWANLYVRCTAWATSDQTIRSRLNSGFGALIVTITGTGVFEDTTNSDAVASGDLINFEAKRALAGTSTLTIGGSTLQTSNNNTTFECTADVNGPPAIGFGLTVFGSLTGQTQRIDLVTTETDVQYTVREPTTYSNSRIFLHSNGLDGATLWRFRVDLANGAQSISIGAGSTGAFEDTTNSDDVVAGSEVDYQLDTTASTTSSCATASTQVTHTSPGRTMGSGRANPSSQTGDFYRGAESNGDTTATESDVQIAARAAFTAKNLMVNAKTHGAGATDIFLRRNTANSALTVNIPSSSTGIFEDTTNQVSIVVGDLYNYFRDGAGEGITMAIVGMQQGPDDAIFDLPQGKLNVLLRM